MLNKFIFLYKNENFALPLICFIISNKLLSLWKPHTYTHTLLHENNIITDLMKVRICRSETRLWIWWSKTIYEYTFKKYYTTTTTYIHIYLFLNLGLNCKGGKIYGAFLEISSCYNNIETYNALSHNYEDERYSRL